MSDYTIEYLADYPEFIDVCTAWDLGYWGVQIKSSSLDKILKTYEQGANKDALPLTLIAINTDNNVPVGMASLWESDGDEWSDRSPWIASVFVHDRYRGQGIAKRLIIRAEEEAKRLGISSIYLKSGNVAGMYSAMGYNEIASADHDPYSDARKILFQKDLTQ